MEIIIKTTTSQVIKSLLVMIYRKYNKLFNVPKSYKIFRLETGIAITQVKQRNGIQIIKVN